MTDELKRKAILEMRREKKTYNEIGVAFGLTRQRIHQVILSHKRNTGESLTGWIRPRLGLKKISCQSCGKEITHIRKYCEECLGSHAHMTRYGLYPKDCWGDWKKKRAWRYQQMKKYNPERLLKYRQNRKERLASNPELRERVREVARVATRKYLSNPANYQRMLELHRVNYRKRMQDPVEHEKMLEYYRERRKLRKK